MSLDTGIIASKTKKGWGIQEINLSTRNRSLLEKVKDVSEEVVRKRLDMLNKRILAECGQNYEGIWIERDSSDKKKTEKEIKAIKEETAREMQRVINDWKGKQRKSLLSRILQIFRRR